MKTGPVCEGGIGRGNVNNLLDSPLLPGKGIVMQQCEQIQLSLSAWLLNRRHKFEKCRLCAVDFEEMVVETSDSRHFSSDQNLTLVFYLSIDGVQRQCWETVRLVEASAHHAHLRFQCFDKVHFCNLEKLFCHNTH